MKTWAQKPRVIPERAPDMLAFLCKHLSKTRSSRFQSSVLWYFICLIWRHLSMTEKQTWNLNSANYIVAFGQSVQSLSRVWLFVTPWIAARQASLSITNSQSLLKLMPIESVMPSSHLILCCPLLLLPPIPPSIRGFSSESTLRMRWPKYWSFSFSISPSNEHPGLISFWMDGWIFLQSKGLSRVFSNTIVQKHQFFGAQLSSQSNSHIHTELLDKKVSG